MVVGMVTVVVAVVTARSVAEVTRLRWAVMVLVVKVRAAAAVAEVVAMTVAARVEVAVIVGQVAMRIAVVATVSKGGGGGSGGIVGMKHKCGRRSGERRSVGSVGMVEGMMR